MKFHRILPVTLSLVLSLPALAHVDPSTQQPPNDSAPPLAMAGSILGSWTQDALGFGRVQGQLADQNGNVIQVLDAVIEPDRGSLSDSTSTMVGLVRGQLFSSSDSVQSDLYVLGTFTVQPQGYGVFSCVILRYHDSGAVHVVGQINCDIISFTTTELVFKAPSGPASDAVDADVAADAAAKLPSADVVSPANDAAPVFAKPPVDHTWNAAFSGQWLIYN